jgi:hypothetical protein
MPAAMLHRGFVLFVISASRQTVSLQMRMLTNMAESLMYPESLFCFWLDMIRICHLSAIFAIQMLIAFLQVRFKAIFIFLPQFKHFNPLMVRLKIAILDTFIRLW